MPPASPRSVAVIIVTHDSAAELPRTLESLRTELRANDELIIVDSGSSDGSMAVSRRVAPTAATIDLGSNLGFAASCNCGVKRAGAELLMFLNPDARMAPGSLDALREAADLRPDWGAWQALVTLPGGREVNTNGNIAHFLGFGWAGDYGRPVSTVGEALREVPFASGAALVVRATAWRAVGGFDPAYFMYCEDLDLSLRLRLLGYRIGVVPSARVEHEYAFHKGERKWYLLERNRWRTLVRVFPAPLLIALLPALLLTEVLLLPIAAAGGWLRFKLAAQWATVRAAPLLLSDRRRVQDARTISAREFATGLTSELDSPFLGPVATSVPIQRALALYWAAVRGLLRHAR